MPRSAEQQALVDELIEFLKPYKGKSIDTDVLAKKVAEIWGDQLGTKGGPGKLSDLRRVSPEIFKGVKIEYKTRGQSDANKAWKMILSLESFLKRKDRELFGMRLVLKTEV